MKGKTIKPLEDNIGKYPNDLRIEKIFLRHKKAYHQGKTDKFIYIKNSIETP